MIMIIIINIIKDRLIIMLGQIMAIMDNIIIIIIINNDPQFNN